VVGIHLDKEWKIWIRISMTEGRNSREGLFEFFKSIGGFSGPGQSLGLFLKQ